MRGKSGWNSCLRIWMGTYLHKGILQRQYTQNQAHGAGCHLSCVAGLRELNMDNETLRTFMIEKAGLGLNEGYTFGRSLSGYMRLNAACPRSVLERALGQLKNAVDRL